MAPSSLEAFANAPDYVVWMTFNGYQRRLYVTGSGRASLPIQAWSGGGQTNWLNVDRRLQVANQTLTHVPTDNFPFDPFHPASQREIKIVDHKGKRKSVHANRGGVLPSGDWIAVSQDAPGYRKPNTGFGKFPNWWLCPYRISKAYAKAGRQLDTFYIHVAGFLGSDGCIVMAAQDLDLVARKLGSRRYTMLRSTVFEGPELDGVRDVSVLA